jgi:hypothetical protein
MVFLLYGDGSHTVDEFIKQAQHRFWRLLSDKINFNINVLGVRFTFMGLGRHGDEEVATLSCPVSVLMDSVASPRTVRRIFILSIERLRGGASVTSGTFKRCSSSS